MQIESGRPRVYRQKVGENYILQIESRSIRVYRQKWVELEFTDGKLENWSLQIESCRPRFYRQKVGEN